MGPMSGVMFLVGAIMVVVGKNRNNDELFHKSWFNDWGPDDPEKRRIIFMIMGILLIVGAVVMWIYMLINGGDPDPPFDYNSYMNQSSSQ